MRTLEPLNVDQRDNTAIRPVNGVSLLSQIQVVGHDGVQSERLAPLEFGYSRFEPGRRDFSVLQTTQWPAGSLADPNLALVDLFGKWLSVAGRDERPRALLAQSGKRSLRSSAIHDGRTGGYYACRCLRAQFLLRGHAT